MKNITHFAWRATASVLFLCAALAASDDPPARVARLQYISGAVSVQPGGVKDWVDAVVNRPLTTADRVWTDKDSRSELHLGNAFIRMNAMTSLTLTNLSDQTVQLELDQGTLNLHVRHLYDGELYEIDTPNIAFTVMKSGEYRFDVDPDGDSTRVTVWQGEGEATGQDRAVKVRKGELATFSGGDSLNHEIAEAPEYDGFDDWCRVRDQRQEHSQSVRYVSPDVIGAEDLDDYGTWRVVPAYGPVWVPAVAPGWAPYHYGHWVWIEPWGWTWVDDAPWGFAPCHYGRWVYYNNYWGWVPGPVAVRPVYAPALVAWVGGSHWGLSLSFGGGGGVGWFPLGYGEPYIPPYRVSRNYFQNVNVTNTHITNITNVTNNYYTTNNNTTVVNNTNVTKIVYKNQMIPGAFTAVPKTALAEARSVDKAAVRVPAEQLRNAPLATVPEVAPSKASVLGARVGAVSSMPPAHFTARPVVARVAPPAKPIPFTAKQQALERNPGRTLDRDMENQIRARVDHAGAKATNSPLATPPPTPEPMKAVTLPAQKPVPSVGENKPVPMPAQRANVGDGGQALNVHTPTPQPLTKAPGRMQTADDTPARVVPHPPARSQAPVQPGQNFPTRVVPRPPDRNVAARPQPAVVDRTSFPAAVEKGKDEPVRRNDNPVPRVQPTASNPSPSAPAQVNDSRRVDSPSTSARPDQNRARSEVFDRPAPRTETPQRTVEQSPAPRADQDRTRSEVMDRPAPRPDPPQRSVEQPRQQNRTVTEQPRPQAVQPQHVERTAARENAAPVKRAEPRSDGEHKQPGKEQK
jgi:FecR protein